MTDPDRTKSLILSAIIEHMPETAAASGLVSLVNLSPWIAAMSASFPYDSRPADLSLSGLVGWLAAAGIEAGPRAAKALRADWIRDELRHAVATLHLAK